MTVVIFLDAARPTDVSITTGMMKRGRLEKRKRGKETGDVIYSPSAYTHEEKPTLQKRRQRKKIQALSFFQHGLYGLIKAPVPPHLPSSCIRCNHTHTHTHTWPTALCSINNTLSTTHTPSQTNQAMVDLCTGACGKLTSNIITVCLFGSGCILSSFLSALSALRLAQVKSLWFKSICLSAAEGGWGNR